MRFSGPTAVIRADGGIIRNYRNAKSPDWDGVSGDCQVDLSDLTRFISRDECLDFDNQDGVGLPDLVIFSSGLSPGHVCSPAR